ncbi:nuclear pore complex protein NUP58 isoform X1 [Dendrobium catenatum]|uniref:Peroxidase A (S) n=1 Tax=Dendrobium catenatum TaxID=906689 RepID=A0A2I0WXF7_9ASPA|nr:nuclear pore complex protein NUP58 isoform X1 [Dendrobium catenatum]PKU80349.1 Peroxidase A (s) [Dendrobium catenatum]
MAFSFSSSSPLFQSSQTLNLTPTAAQLPPSFLTQNPQFPSFAQPQSQQQPQQQQVYLFTNDRSPASYNTKFEELHSDSQKFLLQIEERIMEYKDESQRLEQNSRLYGSSMSSDSFELDASHILQELGGISAAMDREKFVVQELMSEVKSMMWNTEVAVRSYMLIRPRFVRPNSDSVPASNALAGPISSSPSNQMASSSMAPLYDFYSGFPKRPSQFMQSSVTQFENYLSECRQWVEELEQLLLLDSEKNSLNSGSSLQSLPNIMSNVHDFFVHVAAKVESLHQYVESMKTVYLAEHRHHGHGNDPFLEADRRETAKREAAAKRVHPTLHLPAVSSQPSTHSTGLHASPVIPASSAPQQTVVSSGSSGGGFSLFGSPVSSLVVPTSSYLLTPSASAIGSTSLLGSTGFSQQSTSFGTPSTSLFGSSQIPSLFGASTSTLTSSPAIGSSSLFATPSLTLGSTTGSGASFGAASKSARPKSRTSRR